MRMLLTDSFARALTGLFPQTEQRGDPAVFGFRRHRLCHIRAHGGCAHAGVVSGEVHSHRVYDADGV